MIKQRDYTARPSTTIQAGWEVGHPDDDNPEAWRYTARCEEGEAKIIAAALNAVFHTPTEIIGRKLSDAIDIPLLVASHVPCDDTDEHRRNCIDPQLKPTKGKAKGWHQIDPRKMCASCACYWHLSCARNFALGVVR